MTDTRVPCKGDQVGGTLRLSGTCREKRSKPNKNTHSSESPACMYRYVCYRLVEN